MNTNGSPLEALKGGFRRACVKRLIGDEKAAINVLKNEIPILVVAWAKVSPLEPSEKKAKLKELFDDESTRADELAVAFDLFAGRFESKVASRLKDSSSEVIKRIEQVVDKLERAILNLSQNQSSVSQNFPPHHEQDEEIPYKSPNEINDEVCKNVENEISFEEAEAEELDTPLGIGLKFDEIEEMIDELLNIEKK